MPNDPKATEEVPVVEEALRRHISRERVIRLIQTGRLPGRRDPESGWLVIRPVALPSGEEEQEDRQ